MKICFIDYGFYSPNRISTPLYEYSQHMSKKEFSVTVLVRKSKENIQGSATLEIREVCREFYSSKITHLSFLFNLLSILRREYFDIVHIFNFAGASLLPVFCKRHSKKWILDIRTGKITIPVVRKLFDILTACEARSFDNIFVISSELRDKLFRWKVPKGSYVIPLGANTQKFRDAIPDRSIWDAYNISRDSIILIYIGDLEAWRRLGDMLKAFRDVVTNFREREVKLVVIGGNPTEELKNLQKQAQQLGIAKDVIFLGQIPYKNVPLYLVNSDIGLSYVPKNPLFDCQPPLKTFEYLAASLAVVATNTVAQERIIQDGINGVITSDDYNDFAQGIMKLLYNAQLMSAVRENALDSIKSYDWEKIANRVLAIYSNEVSQKRY